MGAHSVLVPYSGVAGSSKLGERTVLGAKAAVLGHIELGAGTQVGVASAVHDDQPPGSKVTGVPAIPHRTWLRAATAFRELPGLVKAIRGLSSRVSALEAGEASKAQGRTTPRQTIPTEGRGDVVSREETVQSKPDDAAESDATEAAQDLLSLPITEIMKLLPHRLPFLMVDRVLEVDRGKTAVGIKCVSANEPWAAGHFPEMPVFPGVLVAEAFAQLCGILALTTRPEYQGYDVFLMGVDKLRLRKPITPGDTIRLYVEKTTERRQVWRFSCRAEVEGIKVATAEIMATVMKRER